MHQLNNHQTADSANSSRSEQDSLLFSGFVSDRELFDEVRKSRENPSDDSLNIGLGNVTNHVKARCCVRGHWKPSEDAKLRELVKAYGPQHWNLIAQNFDGRSGKSCRLRWYNQLDPKINKGLFTEEEEERLMEANKAYGNKWSMISRLFPGRTDNALKNHWHVMMAKKQRENARGYTRKTNWTAAFTLPPATNYSTVTDNSALVVKDQEYGGDAAQVLIGSMPSSFIPYLPNRLISSSSSVAGAAGTESIPWHLAKDNYPRMMLCTNTLGFAAAPWPIPPAAYHNQETTAPPAFIDFLGVGST